MTDLQQVVESVPTEFDYFEPRMIQAAVTSEYDQAFLPITSLQPGAPIEFVVPSSDNQYLDLSNSKLEVKCKITKANGTDIEGDSNVGPVNMLLHALFKSVDMEINNKLVTEPSTMHGYRAFMESILTYFEGVEKTRLLSEGWVKDEGNGDALDDFRVGAAGANSGFKTRARKYANSAVITLLGRPHLDLFHQNKDLPPNCSIKLRLIPNEYAFYLKKHTDDAELYRLKIMATRLFMRTKEVTPSFALAHLTMAQKHNIRIPYTKVALKTIRIPNGTSTYQHDGVYMGQLPDRIVIALVGDKRMNVTYTLNPFRFSHFGLSYLALKVNGEQIPRIAYEPIFTTND